MTDRPFRVVLITQTAPLYLGSFIDDLLGQLPREVEVVSVAALPPIFKKNSFEEAVARWELYGTRDFALMCLSIAWGQFRNLFPGVHPVHTRLEKVLKSRGIPLKRLRGMSDLGFMLEGSDLLVSIACPKILKADLYEKPTKGAINYHTGDLPNYRGRQPLYWAMLHGETEVGITVHRMAPAVDTGVILGQRHVDISGLRALHQVYLKTLPVGAQLLAKTVAQLSKGEEQEKENNTKEGSRFSFPSKADGVAFRQKGLRYF